MNQIFNTQVPKRPLYIFDLDGTLALIDHRAHMVQSPLIPDRQNGGMKKDPDFKPNWKAFYEACDQDAPNWPVIGTMLQLYSIGCDIRIWSGREDSVKGKTFMWLHAHTKIPLIILEQMIKMRPEGDYTEDHVMKRKWLHLMSKPERERLAAVFCDRDKVVKMWREERVACFQVAPGAF